MGVLGGAWCVPGSAWRFLEKALVLVIFSSLGAPEEIPESSSAVLRGSLGSQGRWRGLSAVFKGSSFRRSGHLKVSGGDLGAVGFQMFIIAETFSRALRHPNQASSPDATPGHVLAFAKAKCSCNLKVTWGDLGILGGAMFTKR